MHVLARKRVLIPLALAALFTAALRQPEYIEQVFGDTADSVWEGASVLLALAGVVLRALCAGQIQRFGTVAARNVSAKSTIAMSSVVRHPAHLANYLILLGFSLLVQSPWLPIATTLLYLLVVTPAVRTRERLLEQRDGLAYARRRQRSAAFVPDLAPWSASRCDLQAIEIAKHCWLPLLLAVTGLTAVELLGDWLAQGKLMLETAWLGFFVVGTSCALALGVWTHAHHMAGMLRRVRPNTNTVFLAASVLAGMVWFANLSYRDLAHPDEGRYAEIPREMLASGDWLTPHLNGIKYFEKPPLQYWTTAVAFSMLGAHEWVARLWTALTGILGVLVVYLTGRKLFGGRAGLYAAAVLMSSLLYVVAGHVLTLDMGFTFFETLAICALVLAQRPRASPRESWLAMHIAWAAMGVAILSKGFAGVVLPGAALMVYALIHRDASVWTRLRARTGVILLTLVAVPWFAAVSEANPEFLNFFLVHEHLERFLTKVHGRYQPWWYFVPIVILGSLPWLALLIDALRSAWRPRAPTHEFQARRFLLIWIAVVFAFFSVSRSKLPLYVLPVFPALALLIGARLAESSHRALARHAAQAGVVALLAMLGASQIPQFIGTAPEHEIYGAFAGWIAAGAVILVVGSGVAYASARSRLRSQAVVVLGLSGLLFAQAVISGYQSLSPITSAAQLARDIEPYLRPDVPIYSVGRYDQTLPFYLRRTVRLVAYQGELAPGLAARPDAWIPSLQEFEAEWQRSQCAIAITTPEIYRLLRARRVAMREIETTPQVVVVTTSHPCGERAPPVTVSPGA